MPETLTQAMIQKFIQANAPLPGVISSLCILTLSKANRNYLLHDKHKIPFKQKSTNSTEIVCHITACKTANYCSTVFAQIKQASYNLGVN